MPQLFTLHAPNKTTGEQVFEINRSARPAGSVLDIVVYKTDPQSPERNPQTLVVALVNGDPGICVVPPPMLSHPQVSPVSGRK